MAAGKGFSIQVFLHYTCIQHGLKHIYGKEIQGQNKNNKNKGGDELLAGLTNGI